MEYASHITVHKGLVYGGSQSNNSNSSYSNPSDDENENNEEGSAQVSESNDSEEMSENSSGCKFEDETYSATVDYSNPETGFSATYTLDVDVQDCQISANQFPK